MKYKIGIGINYWDDPKGLLRILQSNLYDICEVVYIIDGRYKGRKDEEDYTVDISSLIKIFPKIHYVKMRDKIQIDKRNKYWELAEKDDLDFMFKIDSDEVIEITDLRSFEMELDLMIAFDKCQGFPLSFDNMRNDTHMIRLWKKPFNFRHRQNSGPNISHSQLFGNYGKDNKEMLGEHQRWYDYKGQGKNVVGIQMFHDKGYRTKKRVDWDYVYYSNNPTR